MSSKKQWKQSFLLLIELSKPVEVSVLKFLWTVLSSLYFDSYSLLILLCEKENKVSDTNELPWISLERTHSEAVRDQARDVAQG